MRHISTAPLLRVALDDNGPQSFVIVMVAIDNMTVQNGCLRICPGPRTADRHHDVMESARNGNPDAVDGAGAIQKETGDPLDFKDALYLRLVALLCLLAGLHTDQLPTGLPSQAGRSF